MYPNGNYSFWVYAINTAGRKSANSNTVSFTTPADAQPPTTPVLSVGQLGHSYVVLNWSSQDESRILYQIRQDGVIILRGSYANGFGERTSGTALFLQPSTTYTFTAVAQDFVGNLSPTGQLVVTSSAPDPNEVTPPTTPTNLAAYLVDSRELDVSWTQSTDNVDPQSAIMYDVFINGVREDFVVGRGRSVAYGVAGDNHITVVAIDANGNRSAPASFHLFIPF
jgi:hypothetical protein